LGCEEIINYEIIAIIIGPLVAVFTVYLEYKKDINIKLQDRKQLWLKKHFIYIQEVIEGAINNMLIKNNMIYNGAVKISIDSASKQGMYKMTILDNLYSLANGNINEHLKSYEFYESFIDLYKKVEAYKTKLQSLYSEFLVISQTTVDKYFKGGVRSRANSSSSTDIYNADQMFYALVNSVFTKSNYSITTDTTDPNKIFFTVNYNNGGSYYAIFISKSKINAETFVKSVMPDIIYYFHDKLMSLGFDSTAIGNDLDTLIPKLSKITGDYNNGFPIKGECENCKPIKDVKKLDELMPPD
jgi:ribonuclease HII